MDGAREVSWRWLGRAAFRDVYAAQVATRARVWAGAPGLVYLCEHPPVITLGRSATTANILDARGLDVERIERGGQVTYHGPGQLMIYPVVRIRGVVAFLEAVARAIVETCAAFGVVGAEWRREPAGVWLGERKIAACGIHVSRGVSIHGFALNVDTPPEMWRAIRPCGIDAPLISIRQARGANASAISVIDVADEFGPRVVEAVSFAGPV